VWVYKGDTLGRNDAPSLDSTPRPEEERRPRGPRRDGARPGSDRPARGGRRPAGSNAAPADGSDKPAEATAGEARPAVKRVRKDAPAGAPADGKGE